MLLENNLKTFLLLPGKYEETKEHLYIQIIIFFLLFINGIIFIDNGLFFFTKNFKCLSKNMIFVLSFRFYGVSIGRIC